jgi:hypothetical protein
MASGKRQSIADRYLAAIECASPSSQLPPPTTTWKKRPSTASGSGSFSSAKTPPSQRRSTVHPVTPEQARSTGNSPSSSKRSRASKTPPRDQAEVIVASSVRQRPAFFPKTAVVPHGEETDDSSLTSPRTSDRSIERIAYDDASFSESERSQTPTKGSERQAKPVTPTRSPTSSWRRKLEGTNNGMKSSPKRLNKADSWIKKPNQSPRPRTPQPLTAESLRGRIGPSDPAYAPTEVMMNLTSL